MEWKRIPPVHRVIICQKNDRLHAFISTATGPRSVLGLWFAVRTSEQQFRNERTIRPPDLSLIGPSYSSPVNAPHQVSILLVTPVVSRVLSSVMFLMQPPSDGYSKSSFCPRKKGAARPSIAGHSVFVRWKPQQIENGSTSSWKWTLLANGNQYERIIGNRDPLDSTTTRTDLTF